MKDIKFFTTSDSNKFTNNMFDEKITGAKSVNESSLNGKRKTLSAKEDIKKNSSKGRTNIRVRQNIKHMY